MRKIIVDDKEWLWSVDYRRLSVYCKDTRIYAQKRLILPEPITPKKVREFILSMDKSKEIKI